MSRYNKFAVAALAGLMAVGFSATASATANPYPQGYRSNNAAVASDVQEEKASCTAHASYKTEAPKKAHHHKKHHAAPAKAAEPAKPAAKPAK